MSVGAWTLVESYADAAPRAYLAAIVLEDAGDPATSAHLYGVAAECAVKSVLEAGGIRIDRASGLKVHFPALTSAMGLNGQSRLMIPLLSLLEGPPETLSHYSIHSRYAEDDNIDDAVRNSWKADTQQIMAFCGFWI